MFGAVRWIQWPSKDWRLNRTYTRPINAVVITPIQSFNLLAVGDAAISRVT